MASTHPTLAGMTVSDLHVLAGRMARRRWENSFAHWRQAYDLVVLNGDIFDFHWATHREAEAALAAAATWLEGLLEVRERARFVILLGNHDDAPPYRQLLDEFASRYPHLWWEPHWWLLGPYAFMHGDMPDASGELSRLRAYRDFHAARARPGRSARAVYWAATRAGVTGVVPRILPWQLQCRRIDRLLSRALGERYTEGVRDVFVGHTHVHFCDRWFAGKRFHNGGAPLPGGTFLPQVFHFDEEDWPGEWGRA